MRDLNFELKNLAEAHSKDIGATSLRDRRYALGRMATLLEGELGYRGLQAANLKMRHVNALLGYWQREELSVGTIKNNLVHLRFWAEAVGKRGMIPRDNVMLEVGYRERVSNEDRSRTLDADWLERVQDDRVRLALMLQAAFGLRREEAIKFDARYAMGSLATAWNDRPHWRWPGALPRPWNSDVGRRFRKVAEEAVDACDIERPADFQAATGRRSATPAKPRPRVRVASSHGSVRVAAKLSAPRWGKRHGRGFDPAWSEGQPDVVFKTHIGTDARRLEVALQRGIRATVDRVNVAVKRTRCSRRVRRGRERRGGRGAGIAAHEQLGLAGNDAVKLPLLLDLPRPRGLDLGDDPGGDIPRWARCARSSGWRYPGSPRRRTHSAADGAALDVARDRRRASAEETVATASPETVRRRCRSLGCPP